MLKLDNKVLLDTETGIRYKVRPTVHSYVYLVPLKEEPKKALDKETLKTN